VFDSVGAGDGAVAANGFAALDLRTGAWETADGGLWWMGGPGEGRALALLGDRLLVGGSFDRAGTVQTASLAALDLATGAWTGFGAGMMNGEYGGTVDSLAVDQATGTAYVGGRFTHADTVTTSGVATLTGEGFGSLGGFAYNGDPQFATIIALAHAGGRVYAAGVFTSAGDVAADHWAVHDGSGWSTPAPSTAT
jgi:hypothetical protein